MAVTPTSTEPAPSPPSTRTGTARDRSSGATPSQPLRVGIPGYGAIESRIAAAPSLTGIGPDPTRVRLLADPQPERNTHTIRVEADSARFTMTLENVPTPDNSRTGYITRLSVIATLRSPRAPMRAGT